MNGEENVMTKLEPRCLCCLSEIAENFSTVDMTRIVQDLVAELPHLFKYVPSVFCVDCVVALEQYQKFKATVERSFVTLEKLVMEKGLNKMDYLEMLEIIPRMSPDTDNERPIVKPPAKILWKCPGRPRKDGTAAQPRFFKMKPKIQPVYDSDSYTSNSSDDENYCRRSDNEEWNPDNKNVSVNKREKKYKTKQNNVLNKSGSGKRGRPRKVIDDTTQVLKERKTDPKLKTKPNVILTKSDQFNGNHTKMFVKRPRGRPPKTDTNPEQRSNKTLFSLSVKQEALRHNSNMSNSGNTTINHKKGRGRPRKIDTALKLEITKKLKARTKPTTIKAAVKKKRGRQKKTSVVKGGGVSKKTTNNRRKRKNPNVDKSVEWSTDTEDVKEMDSSDSDTMTEDLEVRPNNYKSFILAS